jgi:hypothetical protein
VWEASTVLHLVAGEDREIRRYRGAENNMDGMWSESMSRK